MKDAFLKAPVLMMPNPSKPFVVKSDVFKWAIEAVLRQHNINGNWHSHRYISKTFDQMQWNYLASL
jgi:hypothetical protein